MTSTDEFLAPPPIVDAGPADPRRWYILCVLCLSVVIIVMDSTILNVAIPSLMTDLGASNTDVQWIIDAYTLVFSCLLVTAGSLSDRFGRKGALQVGIVLFLVGCASAALSDSVTQLTLSRGFMGIGGALIMPSTLSILTNVFRDPRDRGRAIAAWSGCVGVGVAVGPIVGGFLLAHFSWSSVFWVNIPIGIFALAVGAIVVPTSRDSSIRRVDVIGALLSIVTLGSLIFAVIEGPERGWSDRLVVAGFAIAAAGMTAFLTWELHTDEPMLDVRLFSKPRFSAANGSLMMLSFALGGTAFLLTQYWQLVHGYSPLATGVRLIPYAICMTIAPQISARVVERVGTKRVVASGLVVASTGLLLTSLAGTDTAYPVVIAAYCVVGIGIGMTSAPATESVMGSLPPDKAGVGSAMNSTTRQVGLALGVAVTGSIVASIYSSRVGSVAGRFGLGDSSTTEAKDSLSNALDIGRRLSDGGAEFTDGAKEAFIGAFSIGLRVGAVVLALAAVMAWRFLPHRAHAEEQPMVRSQSTPAAAACD